MFTCECVTATYVGHSCKMLKSRVFQHGNKGRNSHIYKHISECETYKSACETKYGIRPTDTQNRTFLLDHFKCLKSNLTNWHERTAYEGLCITQLQPTLNKQLKFKKPNLICGCITKIDEYDSLIRS